jgi:hypothetical protein
MKDSPCNHEDAVHRALAGGEWSDDLRGHVAECPVCSDLVAVVRFMGAHADELAGDRPLPDSTYLWWRAQLQSRADAAERATKIISVFQRIALAGGSVLGGLGVFWLWPRLADWLGALKPDTIPNPLPADMAPPWLVIAASAGVIAGWLLIDTWERWAERRVSGG